jgi:hypothetical protein
LLGQLADIRARHKRLFARTGQDQHANSVIVARIAQRVAQLLNRLPVQGVQHLRTIERDECDSVPFLVQNIFVAHLVFSSLRPL